MSETLLQKLAKIRAEVKNVPKDGWNDYHKYFYVKEESAIEAVRGLLIREQIFIIPNYTWLSRVGDLTTLSGEFIFVDVPSGEQLTVRIPSEGADKGDKGVYKAETGGLKQLLMKVFLISTGDDPENEGGEAKTSKKATTVATKPNEGAKAEPTTVAPPQTDSKEARNAELKRLADEVLPGLGIKKAREVLGAWIKKVSGKSDLRTLTAEEWAPVMKQLKEAENTPQGLSIGNNALRHLLEPE